MLIHRRLTAGPICCRVTAYEYFRDHLDNLDTTEGLVQAATAISMHALDDVDPEEVVAQLRGLSLRIRQLAPSGSTPALQANLHAVLFEEEGFFGNSEHYYNALNSYLPAVLAWRKGLPVTLALIYKAVANGVGLDAEGLNAPGHFLVRVRSLSGWMIVDPFFGGQALSREEAYARLDRVHSTVLPRHEQFLVPATHDQWIERMLGNLRALFSRDRRFEDLQAMNELLNLLRLHRPRARAASA
jgi:regulator of sirC expression with transglutaminase-like and TPR domain